MCTSYVQFHAAEYRRFYTLYVRMYTHVHTNSCPNTHNAHTDTSTQQVINRCQHTCTHCIHSLSHSEYIWCQCLPCLLSAVFPPHHPDDAVTNREHQPQDSFPTLPTHPLMYVVTTVIVQHLQEVEEASRSTPPPCCACVATLQVRSFGDTTRID